MSRPLPSPGVAAPPRALDFVWLELTHRCNLRCDHCYTSSTPRTPLATLPTVRWRALLEELAALGAATVQLTGGEPTEHPDLFELLAHGAGLGLGLELYTNAAGLTDADLDRLAALGVAVATSLHSHRPEVHDAITGTPGSFERTAQAIEGLTRRGVEVRVAAILMERNAGDVPGLEALVRGRGVLSGLKTDPVRPTGRGLRAEPPGRPASCAGREDGAFRALHTDPAGPPAPTCWDGKLAIAPSGEVYPCIFARGLPVGSVAAAPLAALLTGPLRELWALTVGDVEACAPCDRKGVCFDCRALAHSVGGDLRAKSPRCDYLPPAPGRAGRRPEAVRPAPSLDLAPCGEEQVAFEREGGGLHRLNVTAALVLEALGEGLPLAPLARELAGAAQAPEAEVLSDVLAAADALWARGLLVEAGHPRPLSVVPGRGAGAPPLQVVSSQPLIARLDCAGTSLALHATPEAAAILLPLLGPLTAPGAPAQRVLEIVSRRSAPHLRWLHHLVLDGHPLRAVRGESGLRSVVEEVLCTLAAEGPGLRVHAAVLSGPMGAAILPGPSGTGKSLLSLHGALAGLAYLSDEVAVLEGRQVRPFPKPVTIKGSGLPLIPPGTLLVGPDPGDPAAYAWAVLEGGASAPIAALVLPHRRGGPALTTLAPGDAVEALFAQGFTLARTEGALKAVCALAEQVPCLALDTSDLPAAAKALASVLA